MQRLAESKIELGKRSDYQAMEMLDIKEIICKVDKPLRRLANNFKLTPAFYSHSPSRLMDSLQEGISDIAEEIELVRWHKAQNPYPQDQSEINSLRIKQYLTALQQVPSSTETESDQS